MTATPAIAVRADTMNARPVRDAVTSIALRGDRPRRRSSTKRKRISDVNSVHAATTSGPATAVIGLSFRLRIHANSDAAPTATSTGTSDSSARTMLRSRNDEEHEDEEDREVGQQGPVRLEVVEQTDADHGETRRRRADAARRLDSVADLAHDDRPARRGPTGRCGRRG